MVKRWFRALKAGDEKVLQHLSGKAVERGHQEG